MSVIRTRQNSMQHPRSSQPQPLHHHAFEHSNFQRLCFKLLHHPQVRQPIAKNPGQLTEYLRTQPTNTRAQTHQNLFTLTKNNSAPDNKAGSKHPNLFVS